MQTASFTMPSSTLMTSRNDADSRTALAWLLVGVAKVVAFLALLDLLLFALFDLLPDAASVQLGLYGADPSLLAQARERMGLAGPWYQRLVEHWVNLSHLNLGRSVVGNYEIAPLIWSRLLTSLPLWLGTLCLLVLIPIPLSMAYCSRSIGPTRRVALYLAHMASMPQFLAAVALYAVGQFIEPRLSPQTTVMMRWGLATASCALLPLGILFTVAANTFRSSAQQRFCDTYLSLGISWSYIRLILLRNVLLSVRAVIGRLLLGLLLGSVFAEVTFGFPGFGAVFVDAMRSGDVNVMRAWVLLAGSFVLAATAFERGPI